MKLDFRTVLLTLAMLCIGGVAQATGYYGSGYYGSNTYGNSSGVVSCQSQDQRTVYCGIDTRYGVRIYRQLSSAACIEGRTWGLDRSGIWVAGGCRAEFVAGNSTAGNGNYGSSGYYGNSGYNNGYYSGSGSYGTSYGSSNGTRVVRCESLNSSTTFCDVDTRYGVRLVRQLSQAYCTQGRTWGTSRQGIWVSNGCRGEFQTSGQGSGYYGSGYHDSTYSGPSNNTYGTYGSSYGNNRRLTCESRDGRYNFCRTGSYIRQAQIYRQLSSSGCQYNYNWGYRSDGIWVDRGCRAEFVVN